MRLDGTLADYPLSDILQLIFMGKRAGTLRIFSGGDEGIIVFGNNLIRFGKTSKHAGLPAVKKILGWESGKFIFDTEEVLELEEEAKIELPIQQFILEVSTALDEYDDLLARIGGMSRRLILSPIAPKGEHVHLSPEEWLIVVHIADAPTIRDLEGRIAIPEADLLRHILNLRDRRLITIE
ncbi:DUF4388 domain-containing protein [candidate division WOR-3 bacterium]|uniref:DUF4388 domain-containing protein n=1 Tax=candidate division WOR-3 bacterium TaxID=2052148 RepID=A0A9D5QDU8_UNCW3|nr:DUF4388 domain-containing protein [candidate division WOR-3 bacterium]MBD3365411.1 DUF4388 domain-containing protein [candidate division WOR-3 bacterium]